MKAYAELNGVKSAVQEATYTYQEPQKTPLTVKFLPPTTWETVYLYAWEGASLGAWPGMEWKTKDGKGWLYHVFSNDVSETNIIFSNGNGEQSSDIILDQDACYEWKDGAEFLSDQCSAEIPFQLIVSPEGKVYKTETLEVTMTAVGCSDNTEIYYTLDGTDPKETSALQTYVSPILINGNVTLKAYAEDGDTQTEVQTHVYTYETPQATPLTVGFRKPDDWEKVYLYSWNDGGATKYTGDWPGSEMTTMNDRGIYTHQFDAAVKEVNFIFNNGSGTQTADLWTDEDVCYGWEASKAVKIDCSGTDVENVQTETIPMLDITKPMYNILGQQVGAGYQGIIIQNGYKYICL